MQRHPIRRWTVVLALAALVAAGTGCATFSDHLVSAPAGPDGLPINKPLEFAGLSLRVYPQNHTRTLDVAVFFFAPLYINPVDSTTAKRPFTITLGFDPAEVGYEFDPNSPVFLETPDGVVQASKAVIFKEGTRQPLNSPISLPLGEKHHFRLADEFKSTTTIRLIFDIDPPHPSKTLTLKLGGALRGPGLQSIPPILLVPKKSSRGSA